MDFHGSQARRLQQAQERRFRVRRARFAALASLIAVVLIATVLVVSSMSGSGSHASKSSAKRPSGSSTTPSSADKPSGTVVPILTYNVINAQPPGSTAPAGLYVPADEFSAQMDALKAAGWHAVTLNQLEANWAHGTSLGPGKPIVITFDGGFASQYTNALPELKRLGWVGVENLTVNGLPASEGGLTDSQVRGLLAAGWELDSEATTHNDLTAIGASQLDDEVSTSRQVLRNRYSVPVNWFCYPLGRYDATVVAAVRAAGYQGATTAITGWASPQADRFRLPRLQVTGGTSPSKLLSEITAAQGTTSAPASYNGPGIA